MNITTTEGEQLLQEDCKKIGNIMLKRRVTEDDITRIRVRILRKFNIKVPAAELSLVAGEEDEDDDI